MVYNTDWLLWWYFRGDNHRRFRNGDHFLDVRSLEFSQWHGIHAGQKTGFLLAILLARNYAFAHDLHPDLYVRYLWANHIRWCTISRLSLWSVKLFGFIILYIWFNQIFFLLHKISSRTTDYLKIIASIFALSLSGIGWSVLVLGISPIVWWIGYKIITNKASFTEVDISRYTVTNRIHS